MTKAEKLAAADALEWALGEPSGGKNHFTQLVRNKIAELGAQAATEEAQMAESFKYALAGLAAGDAEAKRQADQAPEHGEAQPVAIDRSVQRFNVEVTRGEPVAWGMPNTSITGNGALMMVSLQVPSDDQYGGAMWIPLFAHPDPQVAELRALLDLCARQAECDMWLTGDEIRRIRALPIEE